MAPRRKPKESTTAMTLRVPDALYEKLSQAAGDRHFSRSYLVLKAVEDFLPRLIPADELKMTRD